MPPSAHRRPGFTLIELLIVVILMAVIASIAFNRWQGSRESAMTAVLQSDLHTLTSAMELDAHKEDNSVGYRWPLSSQDFITSPGVTVDTMPGTLDPQRGYGVAARHAGLARTASWCVSMGTPAGPVLPARDGRPVQPSVAYNCTF